MPIHAQTSWNRTAVRLTLLLAAALVIGLVLGHPWPALAIAAVGVLAWQQIRLRRVVRHLSSRQRIAPHDGNDAWSALGHLLHRNQEQTRHRAQRLVEMLRAYRAAATALPELAERIATEILSLGLQQGLKFGDFAVLYRGNHQARLLEIKLQAHQIPYTITGGTSFFSRSEIKDIMAYLRLIVNPEDDNAFLRIVNTPRRKIGPSIIEGLANYASEREQFGRPIADFQNTQFTLADMATELEAARALLYLAAAKVTANAPDKTRFAAMAKRLASDTGSAVADRALQLHGGYGYLMDYPVERFWRDLRVHSILEGTNQIMRLIVGRDLVRQ